MSWTDLEQQIDRELGALPQPEAPPTFAANVMRAVAARAEQPTPWWSRAWLVWPRLAQAASLAFVVLAAIAAWREVPALWAWATSASAAATTPAWLAGLSDVAGSVLALARLPWQMLQPVISYFALLALVASIATTAFWYALTRLNTEGVFLR